MIADYEGVVGPGSHTMKIGLLVRQNRCELISKMTGLSVEKSLEFGRALQRKHNTESYEYVICLEFGITLAEYSSQVYAPILPALRKELKKDDSLPMLLNEVGLPKAILSNTAGVYVNSCLAAQGLEGHFSFVVAAEELDNGKIAKPQKEAYLKALEITGFDPKETIYLDDIQINLVVPHDFGMSTAQIGA